jgi:hypothetical protein
MLLYVNQKRGNLQDQFEQYWHSLLDDASKAINYRLFKDYFVMEV